MNKFIKTYWFPAFFVFVIMAEMIFHAFMIAFNYQEKPGQVQYLFVGIFIVSLIILLNDMEKKMHGYNMPRILFSLLLIIILYYATQLYNDKNSIFYPYYITYLLSFGVKCVPAVIIGMHYIFNQPTEKVDRVIPFFILPVGLIIGSMGFVVAMSNELVGRSNEDDGTGLNYQMLAYYMAELYAYCAYYLFYSSARNSKQFRVMKFIMFPAMLFFASVCVISGSRGALVFLIGISAYIVYTLKKTHRMTRGQILLLITVVSLVFIYLFAKFDFSNSIGLDRVINHFSDDELREELRAKAYNSFLSSPIIGHGLGSVWWEIGSYSHNLILDFLVDLGLVGTAIIFHIICTMTYRLMKLSYVNNSFFFILFMYSRILLATMVSGYWIGSYHLWLVYGMMMVMTKTRYKALILSAHQH